ncbi:flagellar protein FlaG [Paenalcaligenes hominis]|uniref:flagellar protein FlaG n=1 Tax=Paenalcaligenes hominis TaxID=643674 RepID=UPI00352372C6
MVNPIASQLAATASVATPLDSQQEKHVINVDSHVNASNQVETQAQGQKHPKPPQTWPLRKPMGDIIEPPKSSLDTALEQLNNNLKAWATGVRFDVDPDTQRLIVSLVDNESGEVIRTVPSEAVLQISKMITQFQGNGINTKA